MQSKEEFITEIKEKLNKLCSGCNKTPELCETELQLIPEEELIEKWRSKK